MKSYFTLLVTFIIALTVGYAWGIKHETKPTVDLPEEWMAVTSNENKPDTMVVYKRGDKLFFGFTGKHR